MVYLGRQAELFDIEERLRELSAKGDDLARIDALVDPNAVAELVALCEKAGIGVLESVPNAMNFPHSHPLYLGNQWNQPVQNLDLAEADVVLVIDSDVPWIPQVSHPGPDARIFHIDVDPLKEQMPLWRIAAELVCRADAETALSQINGWLAANAPDLDAAPRRAS